MGQADPQPRRGRIMSGEYVKEKDAYTDRNNKVLTSRLPRRKAHKPDLTSAGQVGSSGLLVAREGKQQLDTTASQLGPLVARDELIDKSGGVLVCTVNACEICTNPCCKDRRESK